MAVKGGSRHESENISKKPQVIDLLKKSCLVEWDILPTSMNIYISFSMS